jgi:hypothetical protein
MNDTSHKYARAARDRLIDMLGIGKTYPLRDLDVRDERLMVPINATAKVPIEISQSDVLYSLYTRDDKPVHRAGQVPAESRWQRRNIDPGDAHDRWKTSLTGFGPPRSEQQNLIKESVTYLHQPATVKVGLDVFLEAEILNAELLDPSNESARISDPRIIDYGSRADVQIKESQEGVDYRLVTFEKKNGTTQPVEVGLSDEPVRGTRGDILLRSRAIHEDTDIRIRATKTFDSAEGRPDQTDLLEVVLPLKSQGEPDQQGGGWAGKHHRLRAERRGQDRRQPGRVRSTGSIAGLSPTGTSSTVLFPTPRSSRSAYRRSRMFKSVNRHCPRSGRRWRSLCRVAISSPVTAANFSSSSMG